MTRRAAAALLGPILLLALPRAALGHQVSDRYETPLPLITYVAAAMVAVAMSFLFVMIKPRRARTEAVDESGPPRTVPLRLRRGLQAVGLIAWLWIVAQTIVGRSGEGDVASLFLWVYGWVGLALVSALLGPVWTWLNPYSTIHQLLSAVFGRFGLSRGRSFAYPSWLGRWPALVGIVVIVWLELVGKVGGGRPLGLFMVGYTMFTLAAMALFGREKWLAKGETFSVWFELLGRLARYRLKGSADQGRVARRPFGNGLLVARWSVDELVIVAFATGSIIFDALSQTTLYFDELVVPARLGPELVRDTIVGGLFMGAIVLTVLAVARSLTVRSVAAGLLPVAVGYLVAHYLTFALVDGQRIVAALNDPLLRGDNLLPNNLGFVRPTAFLPASMLWTIQLGAVIGGHLVGAWAGHAVLNQDVVGASARRQLPLAVLMIALTSLTLWSLGQDMFATSASGG